ncbi:MAG: VWA domain-containing protein [Chloroflexota bacterium]
MKGIVSNGKQTQHVAIVLDRSGSMEECRDATISGFNEYVVSLRQAAAEDGARIRVTLTTFNDQVEATHVRAPLDHLHRLTHATYVPNGCTAMLDAVGLTIDRLERTVKDTAHKIFTVCIISDGYENASRRYTYPDIAQRIRRLTEAGNWTFTYLGSSQDLSQVSKQLAIAPGNMAVYSATDAGTRSAWQAHARATRRSMAERDSEVPAMDFYGGEGIATIDEDGTQS